MSIISVNEREEKIIREYAEENYVTIYELFVLPF